MSQSLNLNLRISPTKLQQIRKDINTYAQQYHQQNHDAHLLAVSKTKPLAMIEAAYAAGQRDFGESYLLC